MAPLNEIIEDPGSISLFDSFPRWPLPRLTFQQVGRGTCHFSSYPIGQYLVMGPHLALRKAGKGTLLKVNNFLITEEKENR